MKYTMDSVSDDSKTLVPSKGRKLSIFAFAITCAGFLTEIFHCLCDLKLFVNATGGTLPTFEHNQVLYWMITGIGAVLIFGGFLTAERLLKRKQGNEKLNKITSGLFWIALLILIVSIGLGILYFAVKLHHY